MKCLKYDLNITQCSKLMGMEHKTVCQECVEKGVLPEAKDNIFITKKTPILLRSNRVFLRSNRVLLYSYGRFKTK